MWVEVKNWQVSEKVQRFGVGIYNGSQEKKLRLVSEILIYEPYVGLFSPVTKIRDGFEVTRKKISKI